MSQAPAAAPAAAGPFAVPASQPASSLSAALNSQTSWMGLSSSMSLSAQLTLVPSEVNLSAATPFGTRKAPARTPLTHQRHAHHGVHGGEGDVRGEVTGGEKRLLRTYAAGLLSHALAEIEFQAGGNNGRPPRLPTPRPRPARQHPWKRVATDQPPSQPIQPPKPPAGLHRRALVRLPAPLLAQAKRRAQPTLRITPPTAVPGAKAPGHVAAAVSRPRPRPPLGLAHVYLGGVRPEAFPEDYWENFEDLGHSSLARAQAKSRVGMQHATAQQAGGTVVSAMGGAVALASTNMQLAGVHAGAPGPAPAADAMMHHVQQQHVQPQHVPQQQAPPAVAAVAAPVWGGGGGGVHVQQQHVQHVQQQQQEGGNVQGPGSLEEVEDLEMLAAFDEAEVIETEVVETVGVVGQEAGTGTIAGNQEVAAGGQGVEPGEGEGDGEEDPGEGEMVDLPPPSPESWEEI